MTRLTRCVIAAWLLVFGTMLTRGPEQTARVDAVRAAAFFDGAQPMAYEEFIAFVRASDTSGITACMTDEEVAAIFWPWNITRSIEGGVTG